MMTKMLLGAMPELGKPSGFWLELFKTDVTTGPFDAAEMYVVKRTARLPPLSVLMYTFAVWPPFVNTARTSVAGRLDDGIGADVAPLFEPFKAASVRALYALMPSAPRVIAVAAPFGTRLLPVHKRSPDPAATFDPVSKFNALLA
jgi:hypothetical protein